MSDNSNLDLDSGTFCRNIIASRSKYYRLAERRCHKLKDHAGDCEEMPFLRDLKKDYPKIPFSILNSS